MDCVRMVYTNGSVSFTMPITTRSQSKPKPIEEKPAVSASSSRKKKSAAVAPMDGVDTRTRQSTKIARKVS